MLMNKADQNSCPQDAYILVWSIVDLFLLKTNKICGMLKGDRL